MPARSFVACATSSAPGRRSSSQCPWIKFLQPRRASHSNWGDHQSVSLSRLGVKASCRPLFVDRLQIELILRNLISNAIEAIGERSDEPGQIQVMAQRHDSKHVRFTVADNGPAYQQVCASDSLSLFRRTSHVVWGSDLRSVALLRRRTAAH